MKLSEIRGKHFVRLSSLISHKEKHHGSVPVFLIVYRHVAGPVTLNALDEVFHGLIYVTIHIIWTPRFYLLKMKGRFWNLIENTTSQPLKKRIKSWCDAPHLNILCNDFWVIAD